MSWWRHVASLCHSDYLITPSFFLFFNLVKQDFENYNSVNSFHPALKINQPWRFLKHNWFFYLSLNLLTALTAYVRVWTINQSSKDQGALFSVFKRLYPHAEQRKATMYNNWKKVILKQTARLSTVTCFIHLCLSNSSHSLFQACAFR